MTSFRFEICHRRVTIDSVSSRPLNILLNYFRYYQPQLLTSSETETFRAVNPSFTQSEPVLQISEVAELPAVSQRLSSEAELLSQDGEVCLWKLPQTAHQPERFRLTTSQTDFLTIPAEQRIEAVVTPHAPGITHIVTGTFASLLLLLRCSGIHQLHAAAVVSPDDRLYVICGKPRAGKTTLTTALGLAGWKPVSDDSLFVFGDSTAVRLAAFKRNFHFSTLLFSRWSQLETMTRDEVYFDRTSVRGLEFFGTTELAETVFEKIDCLVLPQIISEENSRLEAVSRSSALLTMAEQSTFFQLWPAHTERHLKLLSELVKNTSCVRFLSGTDLLFDPHRTAQLLATIR